MESSLTDQRYWSFVHKAVNTMIKLSLRYARFALAALATVGFKLSAN
jgi:hypothetical protein